MQKSFDLKTCPLCGGSLAVRMPQAGSFDGTKRYLCSTHVPGTKIAHYHIAFKPSGLQIQVVQAFPYFIHNKSDSDRTQVYSLSNNEETLVLDIPRLNIHNTTSEQLSNRIRTLILFS